MTNKLLDSLRLACNWLVDIAQVKNRRLEDDPCRPDSCFSYDDWRGAIKGEYAHSQNHWYFFCPIWHTGQAVLSLAKASKILSDNRLLDAAKYSADFILRNQVAAPEDKDYGMIMAMEGLSNLEKNRISSSAVLEALSGLVELYHQTNKPLYLNSVDNALKWIAAKAWLPEQRLIQDLYDLETHRHLPNVYGTAGRPLADDAMFLIVGRLTDNETLINIYYKILERLIEDEDPAGNWIGYVPCRRELGFLHPRQSYWWGMPFIDAYLDSDDDRFLDVAKRAGQWYKNAQRRDGGIFRNTYPDFKTRSFGHCASGAASAVKLWSRLWQIDHSDEWLLPIRKGLDFCRMMQITDCGNKLLHGVIVEKFQWPNGTDRLPLHIRDLGTIFYIQAVCEVINSGIIKHIAELKYDFCP